MRDKRTVVLNVLRMLKNNINEQVKEGAELSDNLVQQIIAKEAKKRKEAIKIYQDASESERASQEEGELAILNEYLPKQLGENEIREVVKNVIKQVNATEISQLGLVMSKVKTELQNSADMSVVSQIVKEELSS